MFGRPRCSTTDSESTEYNEVLAKLDKGRRSLEKLRWRNASLWLLLSIVSALLYWGYFEYRGAIKAYLQTRVSVRELHLEAIIREVLTDLLFGFRMMLPLFAPLADAVCFTRLALLSDIGLYLFLRIAFVHLAWHEWNGLSTFEQIYYFGWIFRAIAASCCKLWAMSKPNPLAMRRWMWRSIAVQSVLSILQDCVCLIFISLHYSLHFHVFHDDVLNVDWEMYPDMVPFTMAAQGVCNMLVLYIAAKPEILEHANAKIRRKMESQDATCAAASVACLIGSNSPATVIKMARKRFRCVSITDIMFEDVSTNTPNPSLGLRADPAKLGCCDAFLSHSWHDDPSDKWKAMQSWASSFRARTGREPKIWFDKFCIDQNNIEMDLQCLPVFLSGCNRLVILCGTTYLSRLWCVIEVFTYMMMGGRLENVEVVPVLKADGDADEMEGIISSFENFDAANCKCFNPSDKDRLLLVIRTAFGSVSAFNEQVSEILKSFLQDPVISAQLSPASVP